MSKSLPIDNDEDTPDEVASLLELDSEPPDSPFHWSNLPPKSDPEWFAYFDEFDRRLHHSPRIPIRQYLGHPKLRPLAEIPPEELPQALDFALDLLAEHNIALDVLAEVEDAELYRFILEEFLDQETDAMSIPGMTSHFIYEEFHPNDAYNVKEQAEHCLYNLFRFEPEYYRYLFNRDELYDESGTPIELAAMLERIDHFHHVHRQIEGLNTQVGEVKVEGDYGWADVAVEWTSIADNPDDTETYSGTAYLHFKRNDDYWDLIQAKIPGLPLNAHRPVKWDNLPKRIPPPRSYDLPIDNPF